MEERSVQLEQTILSFLSGQSVEAGNAFFLHFVDSDEAWTLSIQLCKSSNIDVVKYFAANMLYTKVTLMLLYHIIILALSLSLLLHATQR
jgi:hypothetical protein